MRTLLAGREKTCLGEESRRQGEERILGHNETRCYN